MRPVGWLPILACAAACACACACADPSEVQALRARKAALEADLAQQRALLADEALYRGAMLEVPLAGMPLDPGEVSARVMKAASGVAVSVERAPGGGLGVSLSGSSAPPRAAVTLVQLALYLPDLSLSRVSLGPDGFSARGAVEPPGPRSAAAPPVPRTLVPFTEARKLKAEVASLEQEVQAARAKAGEDLSARGPAALAAARSPDRFRRQAAVVHSLLAGPAPLAVTADIDFRPPLVAARGTLAPGRQAIDAVPLFKPDHEVVSLSEDGGRFALKLSPRAPAATPR